ncbi:MAG TPA: hypothetical protein PLA43_13620 [Bryobacteraceae bacterium]|nr:hypothetical protein [Bryobacteraceae bacterium]HOL72877.1 hypothetical protein [Bryobacteraceae bacterium]HOQ46867.1 hypothetical protein [Bryobacteraceae bacterium]HPQ16497.1 hypothetical protein [Bryobacteraceae bacterium]HPU72992.1 hypothetical protein [Bryobacteraceae bacterium]
MLSLIWGLVAFIGMMFGFFPILIFINWVNLPFAAAGLAIGLVSLVKSKPVDNAPWLVGITCCALAVAIGIVRLAVANSPI